MKSWISFLIPNDEYKEKKMLYFFSEGGIFLFLCLLLMAAFNRFFSISAGTVLLLSIAAFLFYILGRYILSGIEYPDVATEADYKKEAKVITNKTIAFVVMFLLLYLVFDLPSGRDEWMNTIGTISFAGIFMFLIHFVSLKRSYKKNKGLL